MSLDHDPHNYVPVPHLCGDILSVAKIVRRHVPVGHPDREAALKSLKFVQAGIHQLRVNQSKLSPEKS